MAMSWKRWKKGAAMYIPRCRLVTFIWNTSSHLLQSSKGRRKTLDEEVVPDMAYLVQAQVDQVL
jgi:hypothetical protein